MMERKCCQCCQVMLSQPARLTVSARTAHWANLKCIGREDQRDGCAMRWSSLPALKRPQFVQIFKLTNGHKQRNSDLAGRGGSKQFHHPATCLSAYRRGHTRARAVNTDQQLPLKVSAVSDQMDSLYSVMQGLEVSLCAPPGPAAVQACVAVAQPSVLPGLTSLLLSTTAAMVPAHNCPHPHTALAHVVLFTPCTLLAVAVGWRRGCGGHIRLHHSHRHAQGAGLHEAQLRTGQEQHAGGHRRRPWQVCGVWRDGSNKAAQEVAGLVPAQCSKLLHYWPSRESVSSSSVCWGSILLVALIARPDCHGLVSLPHAAMPQPAAAGAGRCCTP